MEESRARDLMFFAHTLMNEVEHSWQLEFDLGYKYMLEILNANKVELGKYLIEKARSTGSVERMKYLQSLNQVTCWTKLKSEEIGTTDKEREELWKTVDPKLRGGFGGETFNILAGIGALFALFWMAIRFWIFRKLPDDL